MYENINELLEQGKWEAAASMMEALVQHTDSPKAYALYATALIATGDWDGALKQIQKGLTLAPRSYDLFFQLALWYRDRNPRQYLLCLQQALWYCRQEAEKDPEAAADLQALEEVTAAAKADPRCMVRDVSIVILSYNDLPLMQGCLASIKACTDPAHTEVIVVDNASTDGAADWLQSQEGVKLLSGEENLGFARGVNSGAAFANPSNDLFILNNDTALLPNTLFNLQMALYEEENIGAAGPISNRATAQSIAVTGPGTVQDVYTVPTGLASPVLAKEEIATWEKNMQKVCVPAAQNNVLEERCRLTGFAILLKRDVAEQLRLDPAPHSWMEYTLFDPAFSPAYFEDDDLGMRIAAAGYRQVLVHNSFVWHAGGNGFQEGEYQESAEQHPAGEHLSIMEKSRDVFKRKWGFDIWAYTLPDEDVLAKIEKAYPDSGYPLRVLEIGAGMGTTLAALQYRYPNGIFIGTEQSTLLAGLGRHMARLYVCTKEQAKSRFAQNCFDAVIEQGNVTFPQKDE